jgi:hypothetical protein
MELKKYRMKYRLTITYKTTCMTGEAFRSAHPGGRRLSGPPLLPLQIRRPTTINGIRPNPAKTAGYTNPTEQRPNTEAPSSAPPVMKRTPQSSQDWPSSSIPKPVATATVKSTPNRIASGTMPDCNSRERGRRLYRDCLKRRERPGLASTAIPRPPDLVGIWRATLSWGRGVPLAGC